MVENMNNELSLFKRKNTHEKYLDKLYYLIDNEMMKKEIKKNEAIIKDVAENISIDEINDMYDLISDHHNPAMSRADFINYIAIVINVGD